LAAIKSGRSVPGIGRVFAGHTPVERPVRLGNVHYIDTGAVFGLMNDDPGIGRLTMAGLTCRTAILHRDPADSLVDTREDSDPLETPFGVYAPSP
jgi:hypothetical protein